MKEKLTFFILELGGKESLTNINFYLFEKLIERIMSVIYRQMSTLKTHMGRVKIMIDQINIGIIGLGTVGTGVVKILENHKEQIGYQTGCTVQVKKVAVQNLGKDREVDLSTITLTDDPNEVINDPEIDIIIEVMGGIDTTFLLLKRALSNRKHVVTANKDLMAEHGTELLKLAQDYQCDIYYEASVAGGVPILRSIMDGFASDRIHKLMGIVNGTTNYILTKMKDEKRTFHDVLEEAQKLGYAEADPTSDVAGKDAARKMALLARLGFSMNVYLADVSTIGIEAVSSEDIDFAEQMGYTIKLIGIAAKDNEKVEVSVEPTLIPHSHPLASVKDEFNAVYVYGEAVGETMFFGPGAGSMPTATAVVSDLMAIIKNIRLGVTGHSFVVPQFPTVMKERNEIYSKSFFRIEVEDRTGAFFELTNLFSRLQVSFEKILQIPIKEQGTAEIIIVTHVASKQQFESILEQLKGIAIVRTIKSFYRVEGEFI